MGSDKFKAVQAALELNAKLSLPIDLVQRVLGGHSTLSTWIQEFIDLRSREKLAPNTVRIELHRLEHINKVLGSVSLDELSVQHIADFINRFPPRSAQAYRSQLKLLCKYAIANGRMERNPAEATLPVTVVVQRQRLKLEEFWQIHAVAAPVIQRAMLIGLVTLLRRVDLVSLKYSDYRDETIHLQLEKTDAYLRIRVPTKHAHLMQRTNVLSKFVLHHDKNVGKVRRGDPLHIDQLSKGFAKARSLSGLFKDLKSAQRPTFHEIRALGAYLYEQQKVDPQNLLAHSDPKMTAAYLAKHEIKWIDAAAVLEL